MKHVDVTAFVVIAIIISLMGAIAAVGDREGRQYSPPDRVADDWQGVQPPRLGIGMTMTGKPGIEVAPGVIMNMDGELWIGSGF
ncbi:hypothetical protein KEU06_09555 [Pseudaminobacter sp. 19-2017]|uniref:Uncharacterized protein n=1 Tax=Pseudaminobacter soli (ex Zhang et al. 2022) TaxID=2831468 RepID=A0A942E0P9_9HYPH|nr:hypothetical protein [Pseudaminobacter soli]MBS3648851.1 hypothetical protein [Pseudaminobacter soli]